jgi:hypothetical protein
MKLDAEKWDKRARQSNRRRLPMMGAKGARRREDAPPCARLVDELLPVRGWPVSFSPTFC